MSDDAIIRGAAHYNQQQAQAWQQRAEIAEARVRELEQALSNSQGEQADTPKACPNCAGVPGLPHWPGTLHFSQQQDNGQ